MSREFDELLSAYLDGEVSPEERAVVEQRLEQSPQLRETLDELSEVGDLIRRLPKPRAPIDLPERVVAAIAPRPLASSALSPKRNRLFGAWPLLAAGTVLAAGVAIVVVMPRRPEQVDNLALSEARSGAAPALAATPAVRRLDVRHDSANQSVLDADGTDSKWNLDGGVRRSLTQYVNSLGRAPRAGEVMRTLQDNAGQTQVLVFNVVDTRQIKDKIRTILVNNSMNVVETETPAPQATAARPANTGELVYYVEAPLQQVEQALEDIESLSIPGGVYDLGPLASDPEPAAARGFSLTEPAGQAHSEPVSNLQKDKAQQDNAQKDKAEDQPAPIAAPAARFALPKAQAESDFTRTPAAPAAASASGGGAESARTKVHFGNEIQSKAGEASQSTEPVPPQPAQEKAEVEKLAAPAAVQLTNNYLGVSAQIDSNAAILESLRNRTVGNAVQGNAVQGNAILQNSLQRNSLGQKQSFYRLRNQRGAEELQDRKLKESVNENLFESKAVGPRPRQPVPQLQQQQPGQLSGQAAADAQLNGATVANPQEVPSLKEDLVRALIILKPESPKPAGPPAPAESAPKKAGD
jgi:hypothetical protein